MSSVTLLDIAGKAARKTVTIPIDLVKYLAAEPLVTGPILYALTKWPPHLREKLLRPFQNNILSRDAANRLSKIILALKYLFALGVASRLNQALNRLALNYWHLRSPGAPWQFGPSKRELVVITGGCSGFGLEMAKGFASKATVVVLDVSPKAQELERLSSVHYYKCDVTDFTNLVDVCGTIRTEHGDPTVLVNNAGIANGTMVLETKPEAVDRLMKVNLSSHFVLIQQFLPGMLKAKKGHVVTIASMASFVAAPGLLDYCCSKVGALYLNDGLRAECRDRYENGHCIQTTSVHPSWHSTGIVKPFEKTLKKHNIFPDPASNVSDAVIAQVLAGRSGRLIVPKSVSSAASLRSYPLWLQDVLAGAWTSSRKRRILDFEEDEVA